jgi:hypothetical protein
MKKIFILALALLLVPLKRLFAQAIEYSSPNREITNVVTLYGGPNLTESIFFGSAIVAAALAPFLLMAGAIFYYLKKRKDQKKKY